MKHCRFV